MELCLNRMNIFILNSGINNYLKQNKVNETAWIKVLIQTDKNLERVGAVAMMQTEIWLLLQSTGGMTNKQFGRVGDSPIIGIGTYANNKTCAISCTGHGEPFIKAVAAYDVSCLMEYKGFSLEKAMNKVVMKKLVKIDGEGWNDRCGCKGNTSTYF